MEYLSYICPNCLEVVETLFPVNRKDSWFRNFKRCPVSLHCDRCEINFVNDLINGIDSKIVDAISVLNKKGYYTQFSCSGHRDVNTVDEAYVMFNGMPHTIKYIYKNGAPKSWYIDEEHSNEFQIIIRSLCFESSQYESRNEDLFSWAVNLPYNNVRVLPKIRYGYRVV